jgi:hypothetical protein
MNGFGTLYFFSRRNTLFDTSCAPNADSLCAAYFCSDTLLEGYFCTHDHPQAVPFPPPASCVAISSTVELYAEFIRLNANKRESW